MPPRTTPQVEGSQPPLIVREDVQFFEASFVPEDEAAESLGEAYVPGALIEAETSAWAQRAAAEIRANEDAMVIAILDQIAAEDAAEEAARAAIPRRTFWQHLLDEED